MHKSPKSTSLRQSVQELISKVNTALKVGDYEEALDAVNKALEIEPNNQKANELAMQVHEKHQQSNLMQAKRLTEEGQKYLEIGDFETASGKFSEALQFDPQSESAAKSLAYLQQVMKRRQEADAAFNTAKASFDGRDYETAETYLQKALEDASDRKAVEDLLQKTRLQHILVRARIYLEQRQIPKVEAELEQAQKQFPDHPDVQKLLDELFIRRKILEAEVDIQANDYEGVLAILAEIMVRFGEIEDPRLQELQKTVEHRKKQASDTKSALGKGISALRVDDYDEALKQYQIARDIASVDSEEYQQALEGYTQVLEKKNSEAIKKIETRLGYAEKALAERDYEVALGYVAVLENEYKNEALGVSHLSAGLEKRMLDVRETATREKAAHERAEVLIRQGQEALNQGNYDVAIDSFKQAETEDLNNPEAQLWIQQLEKVYDKYIKINTAINLAQEQIDLLEFAVAENTVQLELNSLSSSDFREIALSGIIGLAREISIKAKSCSVFENQIDGLIDNANTALIDEDYDDALRYLDDATSILNRFSIDSSRVRGLITNIRKRKSEQDQIISNLISKANESLASNRDDAMEQSFLLLQKYENESREVEAIIRKLKQKRDAVAAKELWTRGLKELELHDPNVALEILRQAIDLNPSLGNNGRKTMNDLAATLSTLDKIEVMLKYDHRVDEALRLIDPILKQYSSNKYIKDLNKRAEDIKGSYESRPQPSTFQKIAAIAFILLSIFFLLRLLGIF